MMSSVFTTNSVKCGTLTLIPVEELVKEIPFVGSWDWSRTCQAALRFLQSVLCWEVGKIYNISKYTNFSRSIGHVAEIQVVFSIWMCNMCTRRVPLPRKGWLSLVAQIHIFMPPNPHGPITGFSTNKLHILIYDMVPLISKERKRKNILAKLSHWYPLLTLIPCKRNNPQQGDGCTNFNFFKALVISDLHTPQKDKDHDLYKKGVPFHAKPMKNFSVT